MCHLIVTVEAAKARAVMQAQDMLLDIIIDDDRDDEDETLYEAPFVDRQVTMRQFRRMFIGICTRQWQWG